MSDYFNSLTTLNKKLIKTAIAGAAVYGTAFVVKTLRNPSYELPEFGDDIDANKLVPISYDYTLIHALHRVYVMAKRDENYNDKTWALLMELIDKVSEFMNSSLVQENVKESNKQVRKIEKISDKLIYSFQDYIARDTVQQDIGLVNGAVSAHLHNLMMDEFA